MPAEFPAAVPTIASNKVNSTDMGDETQPLAEGDHAAHHNKLAQEVIAIATALGVNLANVLKRTALFSRAGSLVVAVGAGRYLITAPATLIGAVASVGTAPTGAAILVDVNKNGTTVYTTQANRPSIAIAANASAIPPVAPNVTALIAGDYLSVDVDQVGSTIPGSDLVVQVLLVAT